MVDYIKQKYHTIFGFDTAHKTSAQAIDIIYWIIIAAAYCFAYHALSLILTSWSWFLVGLTSLGVVGLPYCVKIILFGRDKFPRKAALLCAFLSLLPTIFDFAGLYSETGLQDSLKQSKVQILQQINDFEANSKKAAQMDADRIREEERTKIADIEAAASRKLTDIKKEINEANQKVIDEKSGVKADYSTGKPGEGPRTKELAASVRRLQSEADIEQSNARDKIERDANVVREQTKDAIKKSVEVNKLIDSKFIDIKKEVNKAHNFKELELAVINANGLLSTVASKVNVEFKATEIAGSDNIIRLSFSALLSFEVTALVCLLLAFLMEIGDIVIVYVIRYEKQEKKSAGVQQHKDVAFPVRSAMFRKTYEGY
jgi:hypothetical protein